MATLHAPQMTLLAHENNVTKCKLGQGDEVGGAPDANLDEFCE